MCPEGILSIERPPCFLDPQVVIADAWMEMITPEYYSVVGKYGSCNH